MRAVLGVDAGSRTAAEVEHQLLDLAARLGAGPGAVLCTHAVRQGTPHYAGTITLPDPPSDPLTLPAAGWALLGAPAIPPAPPVPPAPGRSVPGDGPVAAGVVVGGDPVLARYALGAATARSAGADGRAVHYPGIELLTGTVPAADVPARTAIDEVRVLAGGVLPPDAVLLTRDFCRPVYAAGALVLHVLPAGPGRVAPFEVPNPTPCCAAHA
jgi:hypothetical protein